MFSADSLFCHRLDAKVKAFQAGTPFPEPEPELKKGGNIGMERGGGESRYDSIQRGMILMKMSPVIDKHRQDVIRLLPPLSLSSLSEAGINLPVQCFLMRRRHQHFLYSISFLY
jgi:hypothetical protein